MTSVQPAMLWEACDANVALAQRFQFATAADAERWLVDTLGRVYGVGVASVDRLVISSANLIAWLTTDTGPLLAKCCALVNYHNRLLNLAALLRWLDQHGVPVSAPLLTHTGEGQVHCDHLSLGVQRMIEGELLDPTQPAQAQAAGSTLAHLHKELALYPRTSDFAPSTPLPPLSTTVHEWLVQQRAQQTEPDLLASLTAIERHLAKLGPGQLATQLIHNDYRAANLLWRNGQIAAVLDFEELRWGYRVRDLAWGAIHLGTRFHDWGPVAPEVHKTFLERYTAIQPLTATEQAWLPLLLTMHSINLVGSANGPQYTASIHSVTTYRRLLETKPA